MAVPFSQNGDRPVNCYRWKGNLFAFFPADFENFVGMPSLINCNSSYKAKRCWSHSGKKHILLAEELANALTKAPPAGFSSMKKIQPGSFQSELSGKTGIIFFKDYWQRGKESFESRSGDHIDLWSKNKITGGGMLMRSVYELFGVVSDLKKSKEIWFWEVN